MEPFKRFRNDKRGITGMVIGLIVLLIACAVLIPIGIVITSSLHAALPNMWYNTTSGTGVWKQANLTTATVFANVYNAFSIAAIVPFVAAAALIIGIIVTAFAVRSKQT